MKPKDFYLQYQNGTIRPERNMRSNRLGFTATGSVLLIMTLCALGALTGVLSGAPYSLEAWMLLVPILASPIVYWSFKQASAWHQALQYQYEEAVQGVVTEVYPPAHRPWLISQLETQHWIEVDGVNRAGERTIHQRHITRAQWDDYKNQVGNVVEFHSGDNETTSV